MPDKKQLERELVQEIQKLTTRIKNEHPELYEHLGEMPQTLPDEAHPDVDLEALRNYLGSLRQVFDHYLETHGGK